MQEIATLRFDLTEEECSKRADRLAEQASEDGMAAMVRRLRNRRNSVEVGRKG